MPPKRRRKYHGLYFHSSPPKVFPMNGNQSGSTIRNGKDESKEAFVVKPSSIRIWIHDKDIGKLTRVLWTGQGNRLRTEVSGSPKVRKFLETVPYVLNTIKDVHQSVIDNDLELLQQKIEPPCPPNLVTTKDANGLTVLHKAAGLGHTMIVEYLLNIWPEGATELDLTGKSPLHWASSAKNNSRAYNLLVQAGADEEAMDYKMKMPSHYKHKPSDIDRTLLNVVPDAPRVAQDAQIDWSALMDDGPQLVKSEAILQNQAFSRRNSDTIGNGINSPAPRSKSNSIDDENAGEENLTLEEEVLRSAVAEETIYDDNLNEEITELTNGDVVNGNDDNDDEVKLDEEEGDEEEQEQPEVTADDMGQFGEETENVNENGTDENDNPETKETDDLSAITGTPPPTTTTTTEGEDNQQGEKGEVEGESEEVEGENQEDTEEPDNKPKEVNDDDQNNNADDSNENDEDNVENSSETVEKEPENTDETNENPPQDENNESSSKDENIDDPSNNSTENTVEENNKTANDANPNADDGNEEQTEADQKETTDEADANDPDESETSKESKIRDFYNEAYKGSIPNSTGKDEQSPEDNEGDTAQNADDSSDDKKDSPEEPEEDPPDKDTTEPSNDDNETKPEHTEDVNEQNSINTENDNADVNDKNNEKEEENEADDKGNDNKETDSNDNENDDKNKKEQEEIDDDDQSKENLLNGGKTGGSPSPAMEIEGLVQGDPDDNQVQSESGAFLDEESRIQSIIDSGDMEQLAALVLNGEGKKLIDKGSSQPEIQAFLDNVPAYMSKIRRVHQAARDGNLRDLQAALDRRKFAIAKDEISPNGASAIHVATVFGHAGIIRYLGGRFPETTNIVDDDGRTAMHYAATINDNGHFFNLLAHLGSNPKAVDKFGNTPTFYRDQEQSENILSYKKLLQQFGADENLEKIMLNDQGKAQNNSLEIPLFRTEQGQYLASTLGEPLIKGLTEIVDKRPSDPVEYLANFLQNYINVQKNNKKNNFIHNNNNNNNNNNNIMNGSSTQGFFGGNTSATPASIPQKPNPPQNEEIISTPEGHESTTPGGDDRDEHGQSMLHFACARSHGKNALYNLIEESDVNITHRDELYRTARDVSLQAGQQNNAKEIDRFVFSLAARGDSEAFQDLVLDGYDHITDIEDEHGNSIIDAARSRGYNELAQFLENLRPFEETREELHQAIRDGNTEKVREIINNSDDPVRLVKCKNYYGRHALHIAVLKESEEIVEYLSNICPGALRIGDNLERTSLHYAMGVNSVETLSRILIRKGAKRTTKDLKGRQPTYYFMNKSDILRLQEEEEDH